jgi:hypothetical protein
MLQQFYLKQLGLFFISTYVLKQDDGNNGTRVFLWWLSDSKMEGKILYTKIWQRIDSDSESD